MKRELERAAARERWAPRVWGAGLAAVTTAGAWFWARSAGLGWWAWALAGGLAVAWAAPWLAVASFRIKRPEEGPPALGEGTEGEWRAFGESLARLMEWGALVAKGKERKEALVAASKKLKRRLGKKATRAEMESACVEAVRGTWLPAQRWAWEYLKEEVEGIRDDWIQDAAHVGADAERRFELLREAMEDAAGTVLRWLNPAMLAGELLAGAKECAAVALIGASEEEPLVELAAAVALEWGNWVLPWHPLTVRWKASELLAGRDRAGIWDWPEGGAGWGRGGDKNACGGAGNSPTRPAAGSPPHGGAKEEGKSQGEASACVGKADATSCVPPEGVPSGRRRKVRVKVWRKERRRRGSGGRRQARRVGEVLMAFFQRLRYHWAAWRMYRR